MNGSPGPDSVYRRSSRTTMITARMKRTAPLVMTITGDYRILVANKIPAIVRTVANAPRRA
jgi:hypothetical protein